MVCGYEHFWNKKNYVVTRGSQMSGTRFVTSTLLAIAIATVSSTNFAAPEVDVDLHTQLERIAKRRIFFGHQSVGENLLEGIRQLSKMVAVPIRVVEVTTAREVKPATLGHAFVAENANPILKLHNFERAIGQEPEGLDIAMVKFCFVDFTAETNVNALFDRYRATIDVLKKRNPGTIFVHITAPLTIVEGGFKARLKHLLGLAPLFGTLENMRRNEYNALLRQAYKGREPFFDLALIESTAPDGSTESVQWKDNIVTVMVPSYTDDGGHLNGVGKLRAAREFLSVLASIPDRLVAQ